MGSSGLTSGEVLEPEINRVLEHTEPWEQMKTSAPFPSKHFELSFNSLSALLIMRSTSTRGIAVVWQALKQTSEKARMMFQTCDGVAAMGLSEKHFSIVLHDCCC